MVLYINYGKTGNSSFSYPDSRIASSGDVAVCLHIIENFRDLLLYVATGTLVPECANHIHRYAITIKREAAAKSTIINQERQKSDMELYSSYDYLCNEPFYIDGIGQTSCPTLRDIRKITYRLFSLYVNLLTISLETYQELYQLEQPFSGSLYDLILLDKPQLLYGLLSLFITDKISFQEQNRTFVIFRDESGEAELIGHVGSDNFETFRSEMQCLLGLTKPEEKAPKFKNDYARAMFENFKKNETKQQRPANDDYELDNMIKKYCTHNKVGINILTVWDMTYYQFTAMFNEYCNGRQYDFNDMMAANTFSYKKSSDYKPGDYMRKLK